MNENIPVALLTAVLAIQMGIILFAAAFLTKPENLEKLKNAPTSGEAYTIFNTKK